MRSIGRLLGARTREDRSGQFSSGAYLTDGRRLLRVISQLDPRSDLAFAELEDCATLEVHAYTPRELACMALRPVFAGRQPGARLERRAPALGASGR